MYILIRLVYILIRLVGHGISGGIRNSVRRGLITFDRVCVRHKYRGYGGHRAGIKLVTCIYIIIPTYTCIRIYIVILSNVVTLIYIVTQIYNMWEALFPRPPS